MSKMYTIYDLDIEVRIDRYTGLWNAYYMIGGKFAGPYKTKKECVKYMDERTSK